MTEETRTIQRLRNKIVGKQNKIDSLKGEIRRWKKGYENLYFWLDVSELEIKYSELSAKQGYRLWRKVAKKIKNDKWKRPTEMFHYLTGYTKYYHKALDACLREENKELYNQIMKESEEETQMIHDMWVKRKNINR